MTDTERPRVSIRTEFEAATVDEIDAAAKANHTNRAALVRTVMSRYLANRRQRQTKGNK